jgi:8-oxo-dGTP pyrophosphatase MutT (NUDIX family)
MNVLRSLLGFRSARAASRRHAGAIPYAIDDAGAVRFLLVTSRRTGSWIFPKGGLIPGLGPAGSAAREAFEEAGVRGAISPDAVGAYEKVDRASGRKVRIPMYPLRVDRELAAWPEQGQRRRRWATLDEVRVLVTHPELVSLAELTNAALRGAVRAGPRALP